MDKESTTTPQILIVDQSRVVRWTATKALGQDFIVHEVDDGKAAWELLQHNSAISLVFTSLQMPLMDGCQLLKAIRSSDDPRLNNLPVIVMLRHEDDGEVREQLCGLGATDFITKPFDTVTLKSRTSAYTGFERRLMSLEGKIERDPLTNLPNERAFLLQGEKQLALAVRHRTDLTVVLLEAVGLSDKPKKKIKAAFERLLIEANQKILANLRLEDLAARNGPARFALLLPLTNRIGARYAVTRICQTLNGTLTPQEGLPAMRFCAGLTSLDQQPDLDFTQLIAQAEQALQKAMAQPEEQCVVDFRTAYHQRERGQGSNLSKPEHSEPAPLSSAELASIIGGIKQDRGERLTTTVLIGALKAIWPLLNYADTRLNLGMELALKGAEKRLDEQLRQSQPEDLERSEHHG